MKTLNPFQLIFDRTYTNINMLYKYSIYFIDKQNVIPVYVSPNDLDYIHEKNITLKELMRIKDVCKNHPSDHYMQTQGTIKQLGININDSTFEAYTQAQPQEIRSFIKCVLPEHHEHNALIIKNWIVQKRNIVKQ